MLQFRFSAHSDLGPVRVDNEDSAYAGPTLLLVADGVGGAAAGEVASSTATYVTSAVALGRPDDDPLSVLGEGLEESHRQLVRGSEADPSRAGMATTLTAVLTDGTRCALAHVGDSRAYLLREGRLSQLTRDHTLVRSMVGQGRMTAEEARRSPLRNVVLRSLDAAAEPEADLVTVDLRVGDRLLLCSDGLSDYVEDSLLERLVAGASKRRAAAALVAAALAAGTRDNVTVVLGDVVDGPRVNPVGRLYGAAWDFANIVDPACVRLPSSA